jgi:hypothetical protein
MFEQTLEIQSDNHEAWLGLSNVFRRLGRNQETAEAALTALSLVHRLPKAHFNLGVALARAGEIPQAILAFETALKFAPRMVHVHRWLAWAYRQGDGNSRRANEHANLAESLSRKAAAERRSTAERTSRRVAWPKFDPEERRGEIVLRKRPIRLDSRSRSGKTFVLVSGLPRSGTSLMMRMLEAGGLPAQTDGLRIADDDNPKGYYEWEAIKQIKSQPQLLDEPGLDQRAIKVVSLLIPHLPFRHEYLCLFMTRPIEEIAASQATMIERRGTSGSEQSAEQLRRELRLHREQVLRRMHFNPRMHFLEIDYRDLIERPQPIIERIAEFLGPVRLPHPERMRGVIDAALYRHRAG